VVANLSLHSKQLEFKVRARCAQV